MDNIELEAEPELILNALEDVGMDIRNHLIEINKIADKLEINPILNQGLEVGFKTTLNNLIKSGKLTLKVIDNIEKIQEPIANSIWLDMREDIYRFFKETLNNIIAHGQPPNGNATQVTIILRQEHNRCKLTIINDGISQKNSIKKEGIGTKIMAVIADNLPKAECKVSHSEDYFKVELSWEFDFIK